MIISIGRLVPLLTLVVALFGCQPLPHPFERNDEAKDSLLTLPDTYGVFVEPLTGLTSPALEGFTGSIVDALQNIEVPASTKACNKHSFKLSAAVGTVITVKNTIRFDVTWTMRAADGKDIGTDIQHVTLLKSEFDAGAGKSFDAAAKLEAPKLANIIQDKAPVERAIDRHVLVKPITSAPGDGERSLQNALIYALRQQGTDVVLDVKAPRTLTIQGVVTVKPLDSAQDHVKIVWHVLSPTGVDIAEATQENNIPHGSLSRPWGTVAVIIANAAVDDILNIVKGATLNN